MLIFDTIAAFQAYLNEQRLAHKSIGFVPTMGALHEGHLSLIRTSLQENTITVCSIFVNPTQFNNAHDLAVYPRTLEADCALLEATGCHAVFAPSVQEMYPQPSSLKFDFGELEHVMEGKFRPGHFNGVGIVVSKLFHIVQPTRAYFGQKDLQQCAVINRLVKDLSFSLSLVICPTQREADGLAMSSRNRNLSAEQRHIAPVLHECLQTAQQQLLAQTTIEVVKQWVSNRLQQHPEFTLEYFEIVDFETLQSLSGVLDTSKQTPAVALCIAAFLGKTRLIDNLVINPQ